MAAASAGAIQTGFLSEAIASSSLQLQQLHSGKFQPFDHQFQNISLSRRSVVSLIHSLLKML